jgi:2-oxoglutarate dehydrogenase E2 component (dihydrolipoamide succinyltransferase)
VHEITVARTNNNDDEFVLIGWLVEDGCLVEPMQVVAEIETSKVVIEIASEAAGLLHRALLTGERYPFGATIGYVFSDDTERQEFLAGASRQQAVEHEPQTITKVAREFMEAHGLTDDDLRGLGKKLIKKSDVEELLSQRVAAPPQMLELSWRQAAIAETVSLSHASIPKAFLAMKVTCGDALTMLGDLSASTDCMIGMTELLVKITAGLREQFPLFFGRLLDKTHFAPATESAIGVTLDVGKGLFVPVVRDAAQRSLQDIAEILMEFRIKAFRDSFKGEDLRGGAITISLNTEKDTVFVLPVILPEQSCMLSLSAVQEELILTPEQKVSSRSYIILGLAYDHRVVNGYEAVQFVKALKAQVESPRQIIGGAA